VRDAAGNLYGATPAGGQGGGGIVFKIAPDGTETILHAFSFSHGDGYQPKGGVIRDAAGNLYGVTGLGGANGWGILYQVTPSGQESIVYSFSAFQSPGSLIRDPSGNFYGTNLAGEGTVFEIDALGTLTVLHSFGKGGDGEYPYAGVIRDSAGNLYGATYQGGSNGDGTVYKIDTKGTETVLYSFTATNGDGGYPVGGLVEDAAGNLFGTTKYAGSAGAGVVYELQNQ
jgi:uncharacterized repeat protein (TIGR03803 family)